MNNNKFNEEWWDSHQMTYEAWELPEDIKSLKSLDKFKKINLDYLYYNPYLNFFFNNLKDTSKNETVLDIGCGWGTSTVILSKIFKKVYSIDISEKSVLAAAENVSLNGLKERVNLKKYDAEKLDMVNCFDLIYSWGVIHHSHDTKKILQNMYVTLKKNGRCFIMVYNKNSLRYYLKGLFYLFFKLKIFSGHNLETVQKFFTDGFYHTHYTKSELRKILEEIRFTDIKFDITHMQKSYFPFFKKDSLIDKFLKKNFGWLLVAEFKK